MNQLCKCTNCETIFYDENPQAGQVKYSDEEISKAGINVESMAIIYEQGEEDEDGYATADSYWGCPHCESNDYLMDCDLEIEE
jgi:rubredoxin